MSRITWVATLCSAVIVPVWRHIGEAWTSRLERIYRMRLGRPFAWGILRA